MGALAAALPERLLEVNRQAFRLGRLAARERAR
jgi:hypothetical protein